MYLITAKWQRRWLRVERRGLRVANLYSDFSRSVASGRARVELTRGFNHPSWGADLFGSHCSSHPSLDGRCGLRPGAHCGVVARAHESQPPLLLEGWLGRHVEPLRVPGRPKAVESATLGRRPSAAAASVRYPSREGSPAEGQKGWP